jgi:hypothetical protein
VVEVASAGLLRRAALLQLLERELADRLEQGIATVAEADEALLDERLQRVEVGPGHLLRCFEAEVAREAAEPGEDVLLLGREQVVAPPDRPSQRPLPLGRVARAAGQERQAAVQALEDLAGRERPHAGGGELERQRQVVDPTADRENVLVRLEVRLHRSRPREEEADRLLLDQ